MADLELVRRFAGADPDEDSGILEFCMQAAVAWYAAAGGPESTQGDLYNFWVANLAAWMYDMRGSGDEHVDVPPAIVHSVHQLRKPKGAP